MLHEVKGKLRHTLNLPHPDASKNVSDDVAEKMEIQLNLYLQQTAHRYDLTIVTQVLLNQTILNCEEFLWQHLGIRT